jgi:hypothetical protein
MGLNVKVDSGDRFLSELAAGDPKQSAKLLAEFLLKF